MERREFIVGMSAAVAAGPSPARAASGVAHVAMVFPYGDEAQIRRQPMIAEMLEELARMGYGEGGALKVSIVSARENPRNLSDLARAVVATGPDLILAYANPLARQFKMATRTIPILAVVSDPLLAGLFANPDKDVGNITGVDLNIGQGLYVRRLEILREAGLRFIKPAFLTTGVADPRNRLGELRARWRNTVLVQAPDPVDAETLRTAFRVAADEGADALLVSSSLQLNLACGHVAELAREYRIPAVYPNRSYVKAGGLLSYGVDFVEMGKAAARQAELILNGALAGEIPFHRWQALELGVNLRCARALNVNFDAAMIARADFVVE